MSPDMAARIAAVEKQLQDLKQAAGAPALVSPKPVVKEVPPTVLLGLMQAVKHPLAASYISSADLAWLDKHVISGAKGFMPFLESQCFKEWVGMFPDIYKDFLEGKSQ